MTKAEAQALSDKLSEQRIDHEVKAIYLLGQATYSVRADLKPYHAMSDREAREHALAVIAAMTGEGDWHIGGELGRAYVSRY